MAARLTCMIAIGLAIFQAATFKANLETGVLPKNGAVVVRVSGISAVTTIGVESDFRRASVSADAAKPIELGPVVAPGVFMVRYKTSTETYCQSIVVAPRPGTKPMFDVLAQTPIKEPRVEEAARSLLARLNAGISTERVLAAAKLAAAPWATKSAVDLSGTVTVCILSAELPPLLVICRARGVDHLKEFGTEVLYAVIDLALKNKELTTEEAAKTKKLIHDCAFVVDIATADKIDELAEVVIGEGVERLSANEKVTLGARYTIDAVKKYHLIVKGIK